MNLVFVGIGAPVVNKVRFLSVLPDLIIIGGGRGQRCSVILQGYNIVKASRVDEIILYKG